MYIVAVVLIFDVTVSLFLTHNMTKDKFISGAVLIDAIFSAYLRFFRARGQCCSRSADCDSTLPKGAAGTTHSSGMRASVSWGRRCPEQRQQLC